LQQNPVIFSHPSPLPLRRKWWQGKRATEEALANTIETEAEKDRRRRNLRPLARLWPYLARYKLQVIAALCFLLLAAGTTLTLPVAVRNMIDQGFIGNNVSFVGNYFSALVGVAALLAIASAGRYYFVIWLG